MAYPPSVPLLTDRNAALRVADFHRWAGGEPDETFIDWQLMKEKMWNGDTEHPDRMAECLVPGAAPWKAVEYVGAKSQTVLDEVNEALVRAALARARGSNVSGPSESGWEVK